MKQICRGIGAAVLFTILFLFPMMLHADEWQFIKAFPDPTVVKSSVHGLAVDPEGNVWVQFWNPLNGDSVMEANGIKTPVRAIYIFDKNGNPVSFSPIKILSGAGVQDTMFVTPAARAVTNRGMATDHQGNILVSVFDAIYRLDYKTGKVLKKVQPFPAAALTAPAVDSAGNILIGTVVPGNPLKIYDKNFTFVGNVTNSTTGYSRSLAISKDGKDVYYAGYSLHCVLRYHSANGVAGPYVLADTILKGFDCESFARHPKTNYIWASAGSGNDYPNQYPGTYTNWMSHTWYAYDPIGKQVVDTISWQNVVDMYNTRPRAMAFSLTGDTTYVGSFNASTADYSWFPPVQMFIHQGPFEMKANIVAPDTVKFKTLSVGYPDTLTVSMRNNGKVVLTVSSMSLDNGDFTIVGSTSFNLVQGATRKLSIAVNPVSVGPKNTTLTILSNAIDSVKKIYFTGAFDYPPKISIAPDSLMITINEKDSVKKSFTIHNSGQGSLTWGLAGSTQSEGTNKQRPMIILNTVAQKKTDAEKFGVADASEIKQRLTSGAKTQRSVGSGTAGTVMIWSSSPNEPYWEVLTSTLVSAGFTVLKTGMRPIQPNSLYKAIFISEPDYSLSTTEISELKNYVMSGGKIIDMGDSYYENINAFLHEFGVTRSSTTVSGAVSSTHQLFKGVGDLTLDGGNWDNQLFVVSPSIPIATCSGQVIASISSNNGLLVLGEDSQFSDFVGSLSDPDNMRLLQNVIDWITTGLSNWVAVSPNGGVVAPNDSQIVTIALNAKNISPGDYREVIEIVHNDPLSSVKKIPVSIHVAAVPHIEVPDSIILVHATFIGVPDTFNIVMKNSGSEHLIVFNMTSNNPVFSILGSTLFAVPSSTSRQVPVRYNPNTPGVHSAIITITSNDPDTTTLINVVGTAAYPPTMVVTPDSFSAALKVGDSITTQLNISNSTGLGPLSYRILSRELMAGIQPPQNNSGRPEIVMSSQKNVDGWQYVQKSLNAKRQSPTKTKTKAVTISNAHAASYLPLLVKDKIGDGGVADIDEIRGSVAGGKLNIGFVFAPGVNLDSAVGGLYLDVDRNPNTGPKSPQFFHDLGIEYYVFYYGKQIFSNDSIIINDTLGNTKRVPYQIFGQEIRFSVPLSLLNKDDGMMDFVAIAGNQSTPTDWAPDAGHSTILPIPLWLSVNPDSGVVAAGGNTNTTVTVNTSTMIGGEYKALLIVSGNDPIKPFKEIPVSLKLTGIPKLSVSIDTLNFGKTYINSKAKNNFVVNSVGSDALTGTVRTNNSLFKVLDSVFSISVGEKKSIAVQFMPIIKGIVTATLTITSNADTLPRTIVVQGEGVVAPVIKTDSTSIRFAGGNRDTISSSFKIINSGGSDLVVKITDEEHRATNEFIYAPTSNLIYKIDLTTKAVVQTLWRSSVNYNSSQGLAFSGPELFLSDNSNIYVFDPQTGATLRTMYTSLSSIDGLAYLDGKLYALHPYLNQIYILNPSNGSITDTLMLSANMWGGLDGANGRLFATGGTMVYEINPTDGSLIHTFQPGGYESFYGLAYTGSRLLLSTSSYPSKVLEIDPETGAKIDSMTFEGAQFYSLAGGIPSDAEWLTESPSNLTIHAGDTAIIKIKLVPAGLTKGNFRANIILSSNDPNTGKVIIPATVNILTGTAEDKTLPTTFALYQNYPNPFNPSTTIAFDLPKESNVAIDVYNAIGQKVTSIVNEVRQAGHYTVRWNAAGYASGIYFYRIHAGDFVETKKLVLMK